MTNYKVFSNALMLPEGGGEQVQTVVAALSRASAARAFGCTDRHQKEYGSETRNVIAVATAMAAVGIVFWKPLNGGEYRPRTPLTYEATAKVAHKVRHATAVDSARVAGQAVWAPYRYGVGAKLVAPGLRATVELVKDGFWRVCVNDSILPHLSTSKLEAKLAAVIFARKLLMDALNALPTDPTLELE